ncbi:MULTISPECIES: SDR family NAD(P)-dependent oxidoreductase [unclassified Sphingomonas]|uniref:SDR family NAD(P)-dependent oxidoreductase n=1 Tax=unclassified Sphingomonas TaxID=196159 RepID=UPI0008326315|nr:MULTISPECIES: SDR family oxidoreductase [unclassified Sphingomonas]
MNGRLHGKVALITGAGSGIGAATVERFVAEGAKVVAADISGAEQDIAKRFGDACEPIRADVSESDDVAAAVALAVTKFGRLDILCNNAGIEGPNVPTADYSEADFDRVMAVNAKGVYLGMRHAIPVMLEQKGGVVVNTASMAGFVAFPNMMGYCGTKGAVVAMTRTAAAEYAAAGIRVNCVCPGAIQTAILDALPPEVVEAVGSAAPMRRVGRADEIASAILFLASDDSSFVTGTSLVVDGGYTAL